MSTRELFGGAITAVAPLDLIDASDLRQIPDTQEVFLFPDSNASIVIEILQGVESSDYREVAKFHFDSLANDNSAAESKIESIEFIPNDRGDNQPGVIVLSGHQRIQKFNRTALDTVYMLLAVYRVEEKNTDIVVTFNIPIEAGEGPVVEAEDVSILRTQFEQFSRSFKIVDFGLFA